jgi:hypothetical protein
MTAPIFSNSIVPDYRPVRFSDVLQGGRIQDIVWVGLGGAFATGARSLDQPAVPWTLSISVEVFEISSEHQLINPQTCCLIIEGFAVPGTDVLLFRAREEDGDFSTWRLTLTPQELLVAAHQVTDFIYYDDRTVQNSDPVFAGLEEIEATCVEWLKKQETAKTGLAAEAPDTACTIDPRLDFE